MRTSPPFGLLLSQAWRCFSSEVMADFMLIRAQILTQPVLPWSLTIKAGWENKAFCERATDLEPVMSPRKWIFLHTVTIHKWSYRVRPFSFAKRQMNAIFVKQLCLFIPPPLRKSLSFSEIHQLLSWYFHLDSWEAASWIRSRNEALQYLTQMWWVWQMKVDQPMEKHNYFSCL